MADAMAGSAAEADLLRRYVQAGDPEAFQALVDAHGGMIFSVCQRILHNAADAEDAAQDCLLQFARKASRLRAPVSGWLHRATLHAAMDMRKRRASRIAREARVSEARSVDTDPHWEELRGLVDEAIADLPERLRVVVVMRYLEGRSQVEIAAQLGIGQPAVSARIAKGVERMRRRLLRSGMSVHGAALVGLLSTYGIQSAPATLAAAVGKITLAGVTTGSPATAVKAAAIGGLSAAKFGALSAAAASALVVGSVVAYEVLDRNSTPQAATAPPAAVPMPPAPIVTKPAVEQERKVGFLVSPNGQWLAFGTPGGTVNGNAPRTVVPNDFSKNVEGRVTRLVVCRKDGSEPRVATTLPGPVDEVQWLGDDRLICSSRAELRYRVVTLDGAAAPDLSMPKGCNVLYKRIAPNGKLAAFVGSVESDEAQEQFGLFVVELATGKVRQLIEEAVKTAPAWSPDSTRLAIGGAAGYVARYPLTIVDVQTGRRIRPMIGDGPADFEDMTPDSNNVVQGVGATWSPDGKSLAFTTAIIRGGPWSEGVPIDGRIGVLDIDGNRMALLTPPAVNVSDRNTGRWESEGAIQPLWSPDGRWIAYRRVYMLQASRDADVEHQVEIWVVGRDGQGERKIADGDGQVAWATDAQSIFVLSVGELGRVDVKTREKTKLAAWEDPNRPASPRPRGIIPRAEAKFKNDLAALKDVAWSKADPVQKDLTWYALRSGLAVADSAAQTVRRYEEILGERDLAAGAVAFGPDRVWLGTNKGLLVWSRKEMFWTRLAVGGMLVDAPVKDVSLDDAGKLLVAIDREGELRRFEYDTTGATWREAH